MINVVFEGTGVTADQYDAVCRDANINQDNVPDGMIFHSACTTDSGFLVVDVWESEEKFRAFGAQLAPAMDRAGISVQPRVYKNHAIIKG
ncbi:MAG: hypothetical protein M3R13_01950 [Armatimonadota bacterium]|nr:hypothetical protein [Armatimonadota bacterium]